MKNILTGIGLMLVLGGCKKKAICDTNCYDMPPILYFAITDNAGHSLISSTSSELAVSYQIGTQLIKIPETYKPFSTVSGNTAYLFVDRTMCLKSEEENIKTFYLTYQAKTDTLGLDMHKVPATPDNGGNSTPIVTFNGRPMQAAQGGGTTPDYFVLKRR